MIVLYTEHISPEDRRWLRLTGVGIDLETVINKVKSFREQVSSFKLLFYIDAEADNVYINWCATFGRLGCHPETIIMKTHEFRSFQTQVKIWNGGEDIEDWQKEGF